MTLFTHCLQLANKYYSIRTSNLEHTQHLRNSKFAKRSRLSEVWNLNFLIIRLKSYEGLSFTYSYKGVEFLGLL